MHPSMYSLSTNEMSTLARAIFCHTKLCEEDEVGFYARHEKCIQEYVVDFFGFLHFSMTSYDNRT